MIPFIKARLSTALGGALRAAHEPGRQEPVLAEAWPCSHSGARRPRLCISINEGSGIEKVQTLQSASSGSSPILPGTSPNWDNTGGRVVL